MLLVMKEFCIGSIFPRPSSSRKYFHVALIVAMTLFRCANGDGEVTPTLLAPNGIVQLLDGSLLIFDIESHRILKLDPSGQLTFWGGTGQGQTTIHQNAACSARRCG